MQGFVEFKETLGMLPQEMLGVSMFVFPALDKNQPVRIVGVSEAIEGKATILRPGRRLYFRGAGEDFFPRSRNKFNRKDELASLCHRLIVA